MSLIAPAPGSLNVIDDHALDDQLTVRLVDQVAAELDRNHLRNLLVLRDRIDLVLGQLTQRQAIFKRRDDASDATPDVLRQQLAADPGALTWPTVDVTGPPANVAAEARDLLGVPTRRIR